MKVVSFFGLGVLFAIGLGLSGMTQPTKVIGFSGRRRAVGPGTVVCYGRRGDGDICRLPLGASPAHAGTGRAIRYPNRQTD